MLKLSLRCVVIRYCCSLALNNYISVRLTFVGFHEGSPCALVATSWFSARCSSQIRRKQDTLLSVSHSSPALVGVTLQTVSSQLDPLTLRSLYFIERSLLMELHIIRTIERVTRWVPGCYQNSILSRPTFSMLLGLISVLVWRLDVCLYICTLVSCEHSQHERHLCSAFMLCIHLRIHGLY